MSRIRRWSIDDDALVLQCLASVDGVQYRLVLNGMCTFALQNLYFRVTQPARTSHMGGRLPMRDFFGGQR